MGACRTHEFHGGGCRATCGEHVVDDDDTIRRRQGVLMNLKGARAVLENLLTPVHLPGQLA